MKLAAYFTSLVSFDLNICQFKTSFELERFIMAHALSCREFLQELISHTTKFNSGLRLIASATDKQTLCLIHAVEAYNEYPKEVRDSCAALYKLYQGFKITNLRFARNFFGYQYKTMRIMISSYLKLQIEKELNAILALSY